MERRILSTHKESRLFNTIQKAVQRKPSTFSDLNATKPNKCTFDQDKGILYAYAQNITSQKGFIYGISLTSGRILSIAPPPGNDLISPQMAFDSNNGQLIFTGFNVNNSFWNQYLIDPMTGSGPMTNSANESDIYFLEFAGTAFDPINSIQWVPGGSVIGSKGFQFGLGLDGSIHHVLDQNSGSTPVYSGDSDGTMYSSGYINIRVTEKWSASDDNTILLAKEPSWDQVKNNVAAFSTQTKTMYSVFNDGTADYSLVGIDVNTGATKSAVFLSEADWPYCLGYVNDLS